MALPVLSLRPEDFEGVEDVRALLERLLPLLNAHSQAQADAHATATRGARTASCSVTGDGAGAGEGTCRSPVTQASSVRVERIEREDGVAVAPYGFTWRRAQGQLLALSLTGLTTGAKYRLTLKVE